MSFDPGKYGVVGVFQDATSKGFMVWTGKEFCGDKSKALLVNRYADVINIIWNGPLWDNSLKLKELGCKNLLWFGPGRPLNVDLLQRTVTLV